MDDSRVKSVSALLSSFFDKEKLERGTAYNSFFSSWPALAGPRLAAHSRVAELEKGILIVEVEHPGWRQLLQLRQSQIVEDAARRYPELGIRGIAFRLYGASPGPGEASAGNAASAGVEEAVEVNSPDPRETKPRSPTSPEVEALFDGLRDALMGGDEPH